MRRLTRALAFLLAGAACTVLVASACAYWRFASSPWVQSASQWPTGLGEGWPPPTERRADWLGGSDRVFVGIGENVRNKPAFMAAEWTYSVRRITAGFPFRALSGDMILSTPDQPHYWRPVGLLIVRGARWLPLRPAWPGFLADTAFYAAALAGLWLGVQWLRQRFRRRVGHCAACDYDRRGIPADAPCPECGAAPHPA